jgi:DNA integrity scanning protein DisA with diadenylate cyclase activity
MIDYTNQINLSRKMSKMKNDLFKFISGLAQNTYVNEHKKWGLLLIVGNFAPTSYQLERYLQLGENELDESVIMYGTKPFKDAIRKHKNSDGAFMLDSASGQLLGNKVLYLDLKSEVKEEKGARHHAAASVSKDSNIDFVITVSEETMATRLYENGKVEESQEVHIPIITEADETNGE